MRRWFVKKGEVIPPVFMYPVKVLIWPFKTKSQFQTVSVSVDNSGFEGSSQSRNWLIRTLSWPIGALFFPAKLASLALRKKKRKELVFLLPISVLITLFGFVAYRVHFNAGEIENRYLLGAQRAINRGDVALAKTYFGRLLARKKLSDPNILAWSVILANNGSFKEAERLLDQLAPDDQVGFEPAHGAKAINFALRYEQSKQPGPSLDVLHWHLENSGKPTEELKRAWVSYFLARERPQEANKSRQQAVAEWPESNVLIANLLVDKETRLLDQFAPHQQIGYELAHAVRAIELSRRYDHSKQQPPDLDLFHWHLENSGEPDTQHLCCAWATYFMAQEQPSQAIDYLYKAVAESPVLYLRIAAISKRNGFEAETDRALAFANRKFSRLVDYNPLDFDSRVLLSTTLLQQERYAHAESTLIGGLKLQQAPGLKHAASSFYISQFDRISELDVERRLLVLDQAQKIDSDRSLTYQRLVRLTSGQSSLELDILKSKMVSLVTGNNARAIDHCVLAHVLNLKGSQEQALWHLNQAWLLDAEFGEMANHLAEKFASDGTNPDLEWAYKLAKKSVEHSPTEPGYRETLGSILSKQKKHKEAVAELETALAGGGNLRRLHTKLAIAYDEMENDRQALVHARAASAVPIESEQ